jgi:SAM-dependent methyltransferase
MINLQAIAPNIRMSPEGYWTAPAAARISYPAGGNDACFAVEDSSFWFGHRNACIREVLRQFPPSGTVFDIGGGNGCVAKVLQESGLDVVLVEPGASGAQNAVQRGIRQVICATLRDAGFIAATLPAAGLFDVVEHIEDDLGFLRNVHDLIAPGGRVYLTVPAHRWLWSHEDSMAGHFRRHSERSVRRLLENSNFVVEYLTAFFRFLPAATFAFRVLPFRLGLPQSHELQDASALRRDHELQGTTASLLKWMMKKEVAAIRAGRRYRFGGSWLAVARKT